MSDYMTKATTCEGEVSVFAAPNSMYNPEDPDSKPFTYVLREGTRHWNEKYVLVCTHNVTLDVPAGVNLVAKAIETLRDKIAEKRADLVEEVANLEAEIAKLNMITYQGDE